MSVKGRRKEHELKREKKGGKAYKERERDQIKIEGE